MANPSNELLDDTCWVYVQRDDQGIYTIGITYDGEFRNRETAAGREVLLWRRFGDTLSAAGYRMILKQLPAAALEKELKKRNQ